MAEPGPASEVTRSTPATAGVGTLLPALVLFVGYAVFQTLGLTFVPRDVGAALFWPAAAFSLVAFVAIPVRRWPLVVVVLGVTNVLGNLMHGNPAAVSFAFAAVNLVEPMLGAFGIALLRRRLHDRLAVGYLTGVLAAGVVAPTMVAGLLGALAAIRLGGAPGPLWEVWRSWWLADAVGIVAYAPLLGRALGRGLEEPDLDWLRGLDRSAITVVILTLLSTAVVFSGWPTDFDQIAMMCVLLPLLLGVAARGGSGGAIIVLPGVVTIAAWYTARGRGPFVGPDIAVALSVFDAQVFLMAFAIITLFMGTLVERLRLAADQEVAAVTDRAELAAAARVAVESATREQRRRQAAEALGGLTGSLATGPPRVADVFDVIAGHLGPAVGAEIVRIRPEPRAERRAVPRPESDESSAVVRAAMQDGTTVVQQPDDASGTTVAAIPLLDHEGDRVAVVELRWAHGDFDAESSRSLGAVVDAVGGAVQRASLFEAERRAQGFSAALRFTVERLSRLVTVAEVAAWAAEDLSPMLGATAAWCALAEESAAGLEVVGATSSEPTPLAAMRAVLDPRVLDPLTSDPTLLVERLVVGSEVQGVFALRFADAGAARVSAPLVGAVAQHLAQALARARLFDARNEAVLTLQEALLPAVLDPGGNVEAVAEYRPGAAELAVGGDWYDVIPRPDGQVALVVGDVVGRGVHAAAIMGQLRAASAALAQMVAGPADLIRRLEAFAATVEGAEYATVVVAMVNSVEATVTYSCAGHPPPVLVGPDGVAMLLMGGRAAPLCGLRRAARAEAVEAFEPGAMLLLYTDGLIERRGEVIDEGLQRLLRTAAAVAADTVELRGFADSVIGELGEEVPDDIVLLAVRSVRRVPGSFVRLVPARADALSDLRAELRREFALMGLGEELARDVLLGIGEAVANAIEHGYCGRPEGGVVQVSVWREPTGEVVATVRDFGSWQNLGADGPRGRGLAIMGRIADVDLERSAAGTTVRLCFPPSGGFGSADTASASA